MADKDCLYDRSHNWGKWERFEKKYLVYRDFWTRFDPPIEETQVWQRRVCETCNKEERERL